MPNMRQAQQKYTYRRLRRSQPLMRCIGRCSVTGIRHSAAPRHSTHSRASSYGSAINGPQWDFWSYYHPWQCICGNYSKLNCRDHSSHIMKSKSPHTVSHRVSRKHRQVWTVTDCYSPLLSKDRSIVHTKWYIMARSPLKCWVSFIFDKTWVIWFDDCATHQTKNGTWATAELSSSSSSRDFSNWARRWESNRDRANDKHCVEPHGAARRN